MTLAERSARRNNQQEVAYEWPVTRNLTTSLTLNRVACENQSAKSESHVISLIRGLSQTFELATVFPVFSAARRDSLIKNFLIKSQNYVFK